MIERARRGDADALGELLDRHRDRLRSAVGGLVGPSLRARIDPSDVVQEAFLRAGRDIASFEGGGEREFLAWLRRILANCLADQVKHHRRRARSCDRQESLDAMIRRPRGPAPRALMARGPSPSEGAARRERALLLAEAVERLPHDYREVYRLRTLHHLPFEDVAPRMGRSPGAVRMLWARALERLNAELEGRA
ncbi:sigma-70 family RNA polymerase sigma factor [Paludisphaera mucosa]|uniref:Sigma-70 family RNA polymerase sigma factor n=1 Tax=Paludisphaera mucosa TaxID=3030827 RepID=A0ABT6FIE5_9BACT|nr:sigma-70 family RNA polymerase sigma factor [Paludisphaera mucosa]MDG3007341.1 sigma-70 family RNA polymerase sigma factor [Paludisphaera mucosa]